MIERVGTGVDGGAVGDCVSVVPSLSMVRWPAHGEFATFPAELVVKHPATLGCPFESIAEAHRYLDSNDQFGKVVVTMPRPPAGIGMRLTLAHDETGPP